jgi:hypothetical protein
MTLYDKDKAARKQAIVDKNWDWYIAHTHFYSYGAGPYMAELGLQKLNQNHQTALPGAGEYLKA